MINWRWTLQIFLKVIYIYNTIIFKGRLKFYVSYVCRYCWSLEKNVTLRSATAQNIIKTHKNVAKHQKDTLSKLKPILLKKKSKCLHQAYWRKCICFEKLLNTHKICGCLLFSLWPKKFEATSIQPPVYFKWWAITFSNHRGTDNSREKEKAMHFLWPVAIEGKFLAWVLKHGIVQKAEADIGKLIHWL